MNKNLKALEILKHYSNSDAILFAFTPTFLSEAIKELEVLEHQDRLAELEKVILDYYLDKGYQVGVGEWAFNVEIDSDYKSKVLTVHFATEDGLPYSKVFQVKEEKNKEMLNKAFDFFSLK